MRLCSSRCGHTKRQHLQLACPTLATRLQHERTALCGVAPKFLGVAAGPSGWQQHNWHANVRARVQGPAKFMYGYEPLGHAPASFLRTQEAESSFLALTTAHLAGHCASLGAQPGSGQSCILEVGISAST